MSSDTDPGMNWLLELHPEPRHVRVTLSGHFRVNALREVWTDIFTKKLWRQDAPIVFDLAGIEVADLTFSDVEETVAMLREIRGELPGGRLIIIAGAAVQFGKTRQYQTLADLRRGLRVDVFKTEAETLQSLIDT
ncbi:MAG: hypothetical protein ABI999_12305 [Acidobacteriota bacterium]